LRRRARRWLLSLQFPCPLTMASSGASARLHNEPRRVVGALTRFFESGAFVMSLHSRRLSSKIERMVMSHLNFGLVALLALGAVSCKNEQVFQVNGIVREVLPERKQVKIEHEKIPNYME